MDDNVLVIGNGFDLAHGLKTKYEQFLECIKAYQSLNENGFWGEELQREFINIIQSNGFIQYFIAYTNSVPGWVDLERMIEEIINCLDDFFTNIENYKINGSFLGDNVSKKRWNY